MNTIQMYAVKDTKSQLFTMPHFQQSDGVAIRSFSTACEDPKTDLNKYPSDFSLYHVGSFHVETGELTPVSPRQICNAAEFVESNHATNEEISSFAKKQMEVLSEQPQQ